jgi:hypothetical protein
VLSNGTILKGGPAAELALSDDIKKFYLGINHSEGEVENNTTYLAEIDWMA